MYHHDRRMGLRDQNDTTIDVVFVGRLLLWSEGYPGVMYIGVHFNVNTLLDAESNLHLMKTSLSLPAFSCLPF